MPPRNRDLLRELEPVAAAALARHRAVAVDWLPHEYVPWDRASGQAGARSRWTPAASPLSPAARAAFELGVLTEDNLPSYHAELLTRLGRDGAWGEWTRRWTAEEARHAAALRDYLHVTRAVDPAALERDRMATVERGWTATGSGALRALAYAAIQELATRVAHRNTGRAADDPDAERLLARVAADENLHMVFYRDVLTAALAVAPDAAVIAIADELAEFRMPGATVPGFQRRSVLMADAGIFDARAYRDEVVAPLVRHWGVTQMALRTPEAVAAQQRIAERLRALDATVARYERRRALRLTTAGATARPHP
jgi:acyl-[acyl-carrier-protein] desaturase